ncbi:MAG: hypothetical protein ACTSYD_05175 [Candidatus Heimdallarchaeaceae archaeon]
MHYSIFKKIIVFIVFSIMIFGCSEEDKPTAPETILDSEKPVVIINSPTTDISYVTIENKIDLAGIAFDNEGLSKIEWLTNYNESGVASGLDEWSAIDIPLHLGDNIITVVAHDNAGNQGKDEITITRNQDIVFLGRPQIKPAGIFINQSVDIIIRVTIAPNPNLIPTSVKLVRLDQDNNIIAELNQLYDDGDLDHGDDIQGDGVFSTIQNFSESVPGDVKLRVVAKTQQSTGEVEGFSAIFVLKVVEQITSKQISQLINTQESGENQYNGYLQSNDEETAKKLTVDWLKQQPNVVGAAISASGDIWVDYESGLTGMILITHEGEEGGSYDTKFERMKGAIIPLMKQTRGFTTDLFNLSGFIYEDKNAVLNKNALLFAPRYTEFSGYGTEFLDSLEALLKDSDYPEFEITYLKDDNCTVNALSNMTNYGLIVIHTHGGIVKGNVVFVTGEEAGLFSYVYHLLDWITGKITTATMKGKTYWAIMPSFIENLSGTFPNSIVYNGSCKSAYNNTMANAFLNKNANTYFGFSETVYSSFDARMANELFPKLINEHKTTGEAFKPNQHDSHTNNPAYFVMLGNDKTYFEVGLVNGGFEAGDITGWIKDGDGRVITQLGDLFPQEGNYMGIISTGLGFTITTGTISQTFFIKENETTLSLKWNFLSEEFMEYVGSVFQDYFTIKIKTPDGQEQIVFEKAIDDFANDYDLTKVSPGIVFDQGDVYMTGWQEFSYDVSQYSGMGITLILSVGDIGDSIYDSVVLLDQIEIK